MSARKPLTDRIKWQSALYWGDVKCHECRERLTAECEMEWDHVHALVHGGAHHYSNIRPMHVTCHTQKTIRDVKANAKVKRLALEAAGLPKRKRQSRKIAQRAEPWPKRKLPGKTHDQ